MEKLGRRSFIQTAAASLFGYSLAVRAPQALAKGPVPNGISGVAGRPGWKRETANSDACMADTSISCDVMVAGGGLAGICAALSAARSGRKVVLLNDRSRLGGNASSEVRMHPLGVDAARLGQREGGIIEELKLENAARNPSLSWDVWDFMLYDKCVSEPNLTLLLDTSATGAEMDGKRIARALARSDAKMSKYSISADVFVDATGDARLAMECGAEIMSGRDGFDAFKEPHANYDTPGTRQGSSIMFVSKKHGRPVPFIPPSWAKKIGPENLSHRGISPDRLGYGYWWIELGGVYDAIRDADRLRFELLSIVMGVWDYIKNSGKYPDAADRTLEFIGMLPGRRDTFRVVGEHIMTQHDIQGQWKNFPDAVAVGGWSMDDHPKEGFYAPSRPPCRQDTSVPYYNIPFGSLIAKGIDNLLLAGRDISCSHVAFTSTRVMATCAAVGQAAGTAAAMCSERSATPREIRGEPSSMKELQQRLLRQDQTIIGIANEDPRDLARTAKASASESSEGSRPENVINGITLDAPRKNENRWVAPAASKPWIMLEWDAPQKISSARLLFDSWHAHLTQSSDDAKLKILHRGPEPRLVRDYRLTALLPGGGEKVLADVSNNFQKLAVHNFEPVEAKAVRLDIFATNGAQMARVKEIRLEA